MPVPQPDEVIELAAELKEARSRVAELESRWESFFSTRETPDAPKPPVPVHLKPRIISFLEGRQELAFTLADIAKALDAKENSVGPYLSELAQAGKIERRGRGLYGAVLKPSDVFLAHEPEESPATID